MNANFSRLSHISIHHARNTKCFKFEQLEVTENMVKHLLVVKLISNSFT